MRRLSITVAFVTILASLFGGMALAYALGGYLESVWYKGASALSNLVVLMLVFVMVIATLLTLAERKWSALMQNRVGPNRARIHLPGLRNRSLAGIPHIISDVVKMLTKESFIPAAANRFFYVIAPILSFAPVFTLFAVIPAGPTLPIFGHEVAMVVANPSFGLLYLFALASLAVFGTALAGWASNNKFSLMGGVRAASQMISYEIALGLSAVGLMMAFASIQLAGTSGIMEQQAQYLWKADVSGFDFGIPAWGILIQPIGFLLFFAAAFAETKRPPFDMTECESEIIGYFVEYSGMRFGMFMVAEFVEIIVFSGVVTTLFLGGYHLPFGGEWFANLAFFKAYPLVYGATMGMVFWVKVLLVTYIQINIRWTYVRFRYDQIEKLGWKILIPLGIVNIFVTGALLLLDTSMRTLGALGILEILLIFILISSSPKSSLHKPIGQTEALPSHH
ncbi:MAG: NADH-quinone oxidoreductase subunit H [Proteobacteria bacterium]|nr:NADH-quinone oxidoreductase subunit H [Cystobacterineae bacterium]MCL2258964.1 NADH-quinone oxidoreductase subunit H [Cystobacterineae bacterium]MCL2314679.1 NADH-quinone oxidoreductase subunit H [Pseudomonadota bacterium]